MIIKALMTQTHNRSVGYISQKSKRAVLDKLHKEGLITPPVDTTKYVTEFLVKDRLTHVEQVLTRAHVAYIKA